MPFFNNQKNLDHAILTLMDPSTPDPIYSVIEQRLASWAEARPDIRAVVIIGSRQRADHPADAWSDLDCILFVEDTAVYRQSGAWQDTLEEVIQLPVWFLSFSFSMYDDPEAEIVLEGGRKIDLFFTQNRSPKGPEASLSDMLEHFTFPNVFENGARVLVDKGPQAGPLTLPAPPQKHLPNQAEFDNLVATLLLDLTRAAKLARRGELWRAARAINVELQNNLLALLEWHAGAMFPPHGIRWGYGRFLEEWADPRALGDLTGCFADNTLPGVRGAVQASLDLLAWLGPETAQRCQLTFPGDSVEVTGAWLRKTLRPTGSGEPTQITTGDHQS